MAALPWRTAVVPARIGHWFQVGLIGVLLGRIALTLWVYAHSFATDYAIYRLIGLRVLGGGPLYTPEQLAGPHLVVAGDSMYPPTTAPLFLAFAALPQAISVALWYVIPLAAIGWALYQLRPTGWAIVAMVALVAYPPSTGVLLLGNPAIWALAGLSLGMLYRWPAVFVLLKPSLAPFVLVGARDRRWWMALGIFGLASLAVLPLTIEWIRVLLNARGEFSGLGYSLSNVLLFLVPVVAWLGRTA